MVDSHSHLRLVERYPLLRPAAAFSIVRNCFWVVGSAIVFLLPPVWSSTLPAAEEAAHPVQVGRFIHVELPLTLRTFERTRRMARRAVEQAQREKHRLTLIFSFDVPRGQKEFSQGSDFSASYDLAKYISGDELAGVRTVAYLPQPVIGHAVLPIIACQEIIMSPEAVLGPAGDEKTVTPTLRSAYAEIAGRRLTVPVPAALALLDPTMELLQVETDALQKTLLTPEELEALKQKHTIRSSVVLKRAGEACSFSARDARRLGLATYLAVDRREVLKALGLPPTQVADDPSLEGGWRPIRVDLKGPIRSDVVSRVQRMIEDQIREHDVNFICLWIESAGGSLVDAVGLANFLAFSLEPGRVRTVAYIPHEARADAALVALACDHVVMHPQAILGGSGAEQPSDRDIRDALQVIRKELAPRKGRSWSLMAALLDPKLNVFRVTRLGEAEYFSDEELNEQADKDAWKKEALITTPGVPLKLTGVQAEQYHLVNRLVKNFSEFKQYYGLENDPHLVEPGWADFLIQALASPGLAVLLLLVGGAALYIELHSPGIGIGGFVAAVCFLLFFWSRYLGGTAGWLEVTLFVAGISCLLLELFVLPGFGIFGLGGGALVLASLILASQTFIWPRNEYQFNQLQTSLLSIAVAVVGLVVVAVWLRRRLPRSRVLGNIMLAPPSAEEAETIRRREMLVQLQDLLGKRGVTTTQLTPSGKARFDDLLVDVLADGEVISRGATVEVVEVHGNRVLVKEVSS